MLYFFSGWQFVVVSHGLIKEKVVATKEIDKAARSRKQFEVDPETHTFEPGY